MSKYITALSAPNNCCMQRKERNENIIHCDAPQQKRPLCYIKELRIGGVEEVSKSLMARGV